MNAEEEHTVNKYDREEREKYCLRIASERGDDDNYDDVSDEHDLNKWLCPSTFTGGRNGREEESLSSRALYLQTMEQFMPCSLALPCLLTHAIPCSVTGMSFVLSHTRTRYSTTALPKKGENILINEVEK